jgi:hypothetical protein
MDGRTLNEIMSGGNWSLVGPAQQAFNLTQQKSLQDLVNSQGQEQRAQSQEQRLQQMHPVEMDSKQAYANQAKAQTATMQDHLSVLQGIPLDQRIATGVAENKKKLSDIDRQRLDGEMSDLSKLAAAAVQNGGTLPLGMNVSNPEHAKLFGSPQGAALAAQIAKAYWMSTPEELGKAANDERDSKRAIELAKIMAQSRVASAGMRGSTGNKSPADPKTFDAAIVQRMRMLATEKDDTTRQQLMDEIQYFETAKLRAIQAKGEAAQTGKPALGELGIATNPAASTAPTPIPGAQGAQPAPTQPSDQKHLESLRSNPTAIQIRNDYKAGKITKEQAAQKLMELK